jgi:hypothetical protein
MFSEPGLGEDERGKLPVIGHLPALAPGDTMSHVFLHAHCSLVPQLTCC